MTVFVGNQIVTILRDDNPDIPMPGYWDMPGGGREDGESAWECAVRECLEETSLQLSDRDLSWGRLYRTGSQFNWFFVAQVNAGRAQELFLGDEGQALQPMSVDQYLTHPMAIPNFQLRLADWVAGVHMQADVPGRQA